MRPIKVGLISDTHGLLRPQARAYLEGSDFIIHAGDVGRPEIIASLSELAPVTVVRGNIDTAPWARAFPETAMLKLGATTAIYVLHDIDTLAIDPAAAGFQVVVYGHSHKPIQWRKDDVLYVNPGSAGPRRLSLPISLGRLTIHGGTITAALTGDAS
ncbi:metallophosphoesterase family protein [Acidisoma sp. 7E03]